MTRDQEPCPFVDHDGLDVAEAVDAGGERSRSVALRVSRSRLQLLDGHVLEADHGYTFLAF
jgi:hypothetical protein